MVVTSVDSGSSLPVVKLPEHRSSNTWYDCKGPRPVLTSCCHGARPSRQDRSNIGDGVVGSRRSGVREAFDTVEDKWEVSLAACFISFWLSGAHVA